jgi:hypothetical protein
LKYGEINWSIKNNENYLAFNNLKDMSDWGDRYYQGWAKSYKKIMHYSKKYIHPGLSDSPIECYCGYTYAQVNEYLRHGTDNESNTYKELADILSIMLISAPRIPDNIVLYRLVCDDFINELGRV